MTSCVTFGEVARFQLQNIEQIHFPFITQVTTCIVAFSVNFSLTEQDLRWKSFALFPSRSFQFSPTTTNPADYLTAEKLHLINKTKHIQSRLQTLSKIIQMSIQHINLLSHIKVGKLNFEPNTGKIRWQRKGLAPFTYTVKL